MSTGRIELHKVTKVFGKNVSAALDLLDRGVDKAEVQTRTKCTVGNYDVDLTIPAGKTTVLMGLSGSGKSTLLRVLNRLHEPTRGRIVIDGVDITTLRRRELIALRRERFSGMVFQKFAILPHRDVLGNVEFGMELQGVARAERRARAQEAVELVGLAGYERSRPSQLSGGMQQRVGLARALVLDGEVLLMDEPFSALDPLIRRELQDELVALQDRMRKTIVFVTHDLDEALRLGDQVAIMKDGRIQQVGDAQQIVTEPANDYVADFVEHVNRADVLLACSIMREVRPEDPPPVLVAESYQPLREVLEMVAEEPTGVPVHVEKDGDVVGLIERRKLFRVLSGRARLQPPETDAPGAPRQPPVDGAADAQEVPA